jgi:hypothetical protein
MAGKGQSCAFVDHRGIGSLAPVTVYALVPVTVASGATIGPTARSIGAQGDGKCVRFCRLVAVQLIDPLVRPRLPER